MPLSLLHRLDPLRRVRCPYCFARFAAYQMHIQCDNYACKADYTRMVDDPILSRALNGARAGGSLRGPWWVDPPTDKRRGLRRYLDWFLLPGPLTCPACKRPTDHRLCPACHAHLPDSAITLPSGHIAIFGLQSVGKTTFITVLIHELDHTIGPREGFVLEPLGDEVRERYEREYHELTYGGGGFGIGEDGLAGSFRRSHSPTQAIEMNRAVLRPLIYRLTRRLGRRRRRTLLSFFDMAGEDWEMNLDQLRGEAKYLGLARGLLFLVDPLRLRPVGLDPRIRLTEREAHVPPADYLNDARKLATFFPASPVKTPLAIVLNKLDRWGHLLEEGTLLHRMARSVPAGPPDPGLDAAIDAEVRAALRRWGAGGFLEHVEVNFPDHRFFACSSLGDAAQEREDAPQPLPTPLLVDRPALWLLSRQGIVPRTK